MIDAMLVQLRIISNPHIEPEEATRFVQSLLNKRKRFAPDNNTDELDRDNLEKLRAILNNPNRFQH